ncbi:MAG: RNA polymerase sigma factor [bacterium]|nr:RNA polymerase sigma factor [bacterium]
MRGYLNEQILIYQIKRGNTDSFAPLYDYYVQKIYRFIYLKVPSAHDAEDLTAETFLKTWQYIKDARVIGNLQAVIYKIARNVVVDFYRKRGTVVAESLEDNDIVVADRVDLTLEEKMTLKTDMVVVEKALRELKDTYREIITLFYLNDLTLKEIAKIVDRSPGAVRVMLHRGIKALKGKLKQK